MSMLRHEAPDAVVARGPQEATSVSEGAAAACSLSAPAPSRAEVDALLGVIADETRARRRRIGAGLWAACAIACALVGLSAVGLLVNVVAFVPLAIVAFGIAAFTERQKEAARRLALSNDVRAAGWLALALEYGDPEVRSAAAQALVRLLPSLRAEDVGVLDADARAVLTSTLVAQHAEREPSLACAVLAALPAIGDARFIPLVEALASLAPPSTSRPVGAARGADSQRVCELARDVLPGLREASARAAEASTLLRPASAEPEGDRALLRPASAGPEVADDLLRPAAERDA